MSVPDRCLHLEVRRLLPPALVQSWHQVTLNPRGIAERQAEPAADWLAHHGASIGARTPNVAERGRAAGTSLLCQALLTHGLSERNVFDAQGNAFDVDAFRLRVQEPLLNWLEGARIPPAALLAPALLGRHYAALVERVSAHQELLPHIAATPGPGWLWQDFCTSFAAQEAAPGQ